MMLIAVVLAAHVSAGIMAFNIPVDRRLTPAVVPFYPAQVHVSRRQHPRFIFTDHLTIEADWPAQGRLKLQLEIKSRQLVARFVGIIAVNVILSGKSIPEVTERMRSPLPCPLHNTRSAELQGLERRYRDAGTDNFGVRYGAVLVHLAGGNLVLPRADPAQPPGFRGILLGALHQHTGHRAHGVAADQAAFVARAPPLRHLAEGEPLVPEFYRAVGTVRVNV